MNCVVERYAFQCSGRTIKLSSQTRENSCLRRLESLGQFGIVVFPHGSLEFALPVRELHCCWELTFANVSCCAFQSVNGRHKASRGKKHLSRPGTSASQISPSKGVRLLSASPFDSLSVFYRHLSLQTLAPPLRHSVGSHPHYIGMDFSAVGGFTGLVFIPRGEPQAYGQFRKVDPVWMALGPFAFRRKQKVEKWRSRSWMLSARV